MLESSQPTRLQEMALERAAEALVLRRLITADTAAFERESSSRLLDDVRNARYRTVNEMAVRLQAAGMPVLGKRLQAVIVRCGETSLAGPDGIGAVVRCFNQAGARAMAATSSHGVTALVAWDGTVDPTARLASVAVALQAVFRRAEPAARVNVVGGRLARGLDDVPTSFREAEQVAAAVPHGVASDDDCRVLTLRDVGIRGLIATMKDDPRLQLFVEDSIGPLLNRTEGNPSRRELFDALEAYFATRGNKSSAAARLHMSRPAFYSRLELIERLLGIDLEDAQSALAVQFAFVAHRVLSTG
jgi:purine catabolism regulator